MKISNIIQGLILYLCFFPFIGFNMGTDTQPFALIICLFYFLMVKKNYKGTPFEKNLYPILISILVISCISFINVPFFDVLKKLFSYTSLIFISTTVYNCKLFYNKDKIEMQIKKIIWIWFMVGLVQITLNKNFMTFLIPLYRSSVSRGVCSLASEPSFYGYMCFFMFLFSIDFKKDKWKYIILTVSQAIFFAQSAVSILYFCLFLIIYMVVNIKKFNIKEYKKIIIISILIIPIIALISGKLSDTRMYSILNKLIENPIALVESDQSVSERIEAIALSFQNYGVPSLIGTETIMSGFGMVFYELGIFSIFIYSSIFKTVYMSYSKKINLAVSLTLMICMFSAIQLSSPTLSFYIGYRYIISKKRRKKYDTI